MVAQRSRQAPTPGFSLNRPQMAGILPSGEGRTPTRIDWIMADIRLVRLWETLRTSFWFIPSLMAVGAILLSFLMLYIDGRIEGETIEGLSWMYTGGASGAREVLSTIAGSMMNVAGVSFSVTIVALSLASSQFGPRLLRNFIRDRANQTVLGTFIATFLYCLLILKTIRSEENGDAYVPYIAVTVGVVLALLSIGVLIFFIHHVSISIRAPEVAASAAAELRDSLDRLFPALLGDPGPVAVDPDRMKAVEEEFVTGAGEVPALRSGYLQAVDNEELMRLAEEYDAVFRLEHRPGHYIIEGTPVVSVLPPDAVDDVLIRQIDGTLIVGIERTPTQDAEFAMNELVEVAVRALSPSLNDPFTAVNCLDHLAAALSRLLRSAPPEKFRFDRLGRLRIIAKPQRFPDLLAASFHQIRQEGGRSPAVLLRMMEIIGALVPLARTEEQLEALRHHAVLVHRGGQAFPEEWDRRALDERYRTAVAAIERSPAFSPSTL